MSLLRSILNTIPSSEVNPQASFQANLNKILEISDADILSKNREVRFKHDKLAKAEIIRERLSPVRSESPPVKADTSYTIDIPLIEGSPIRPSVPIMPSVELPEEVDMEYPMKLFSDKKNIKPMKIKKLNLPRSSTRIKEVKEPNSVAYDSQKVQRFTNPQITSLTELDFNDDFDTRPKSPTRSRRN